MAPEDVAKVAVLMASLPPEVNAHAADAAARREDAKVAVLRVVRASHVRLRCLGVEIVGNHGRPRIREELSAA